LGQMITSSYYREQVARVEDIMKTPVLSVNGDSSILELAQKMISERPKVYPVIDRSGELMGSINRSEVLNAIDVQLRSGYQSHGR
jgi:predicted transcriptional regulator